ncbi:MAG: DUF2530 domain-containing protein [Bifidobacterium sp.]|jgi:cell division septal protein FtsQ|nr:DUF2530 domain-containing protein [Bifidobacterium sp.]MCI1864834.1 DUF2530 domain-containing protein [Bifidobacterium sp.]
MKFAPIVNPDARRPAPKPVRVDLRKVFALGTVLWLVALIVSVVLLALHHGAMNLVTVCISGTVLGMVLLLWEHLDRSDYRRLGQ